MEAIVISYFENIFRSFSPSPVAIGTVVDSLDTRISPTAVRHLEGVFSGEQIADILGVRIVGCHERYIGLPSFIFRKKKHLFTNIKDRVWALISGWQGTLFSIVGNEVLLMALLPVIPTTYGCLRPSIFKVLSRPMLGEVLMISQLKTESGAWNVSLLEQNFL
ncbi:hypothetical protein JRO89_XS07G0170900 [Xanthoceras sorbifolium]|uniref:Uncharacterized protein n=1 Tax=Xanthoceras sorbifolium TaxID=99658 RepID=A0ABQ8HUA9_9ROSI|nr:hypothetical protein JRO89_XS07G0170900 [Xanthoceras sorbifolium]